MTFTVPVVCLGFNERAITGRMKTHVFGGFFFFCRTYTCAVLGALSALPAAGTSAREVVWLEKGTTETQGALGWKGP